MNKFFKKAQVDGLSKKQQKDEAAQEMARAIKELAIARLDKEELTRRDIRAAIEILDGAFWLLHGLES